MSFRNIFALLLLLPWTAQVMAQSIPTENRCGWFENPSPQNVWLLDREGEWEISMQGGSEAQGDWPKFKPSQWVNAANGSYGFGCACMKVVTDKAAHAIRKIVSAQARPLGACRNDRALKEPAD